MPIRPTATGLVLCELAIVDEKTRSISTIGSFSRRVIEVPVEYMPAFYVVANLVDGHGTMAARLVIERLDTLEITYWRPFALAFAGPLQELTGIFRIRAHAIPVFGDYQAMLLVDGELIAHKKFSILKKEATP